MLAAFRWREGALTRVRPGRSLTAHPVHPREVRGLSHGDPARSQQRRKHIWERGGMKRAWGCEPQGPHLYKQVLPAQSAGEVRGLPTARGQEQVIASTEQ